MNLYRIRNKKTMLYACAGTKPDSREGKWFTAKTLKLHLTQFFKRSWKTGTYSRNKHYPYNNEYEVVVYKVYEENALDLALHVDMMLEVKNKHGELYL